MTAFPDARTPTFAPQAGVWRFVHDRLLRRERVALLVVVASKGHAPGKPGFKMAVDSRGALCGTIGGGAIEYDTVEAAKLMLARRRAVPSVELKVHDVDHPLASGMICGGSQTVVTYPSCARDRAAIGELLACIEAGRSGEIALSPAGMKFSTGSRLRRPFTFGGPADAWIFRERVRMPDTVYLLGGGHVAVALSRVLATLDFRIVVIDDRAEIQTAAWNPHAHELLVMPYARAGKAVPPGPNSYVVVMTHGHRSDAIALRQVARKRLRYLGVLASQWKAREVLDFLAAAGFPPSVADRVHTPAGLTIGSHTPSEIAISIAAQLIAVRNLGSPGSR